ncbi:thiamine biosynthesis protein [Chryseobacterium sp. Leaf180]|uniref:HesA/MoeB/ThiF family protein n=1 Tax=Chryseobacterium sp. Leaf180 TaxID=1736289 RepID=UPI0006FBA4A2|nr:HesA/MoeB/ThiF family protein [Chryseobacterium sp. Leaf180]KQR94812.1 thiamine biosynthesis protein [Chryseobacterium sp. Leaf180]
MNPDFERYNCQIALPSFGENSQQLLQNAKVMIVGMGGLGCPAAQYLVSSGVGTIALVDDDVVSVSNLHRQILYSPEDVGKSKVDIAAKRLTAQNPDIKIVSINKRIDSQNVLELIEEYDLIIEGTDNFETKYLLNDACVLAKKPLVYGAIFQFEGQVSVWNVEQIDGNFSPNYRDVYPDIASHHIPNCREGGVLPALAGMVGCMQAGEAIKYLTKSADLFAGKLWMIDMRSGKTQVIKLPKYTSTHIVSLQESVKQISFKDFNENSDDFELIDVRSSEEHSNENIGGKNIKPENLKDFISSNQVKKSLVLYCQSGKRSSAAAVLIQKEFPQLDIYSLRGGIQDSK